MVNKRTRTVLATNLRGQAGRKVCEERLQGSMDGRRQGGNDRGAQERSGDHSGEVVVVVGRQVVAVNQHIVYGLNTARQERKGGDSKYK